MCSSDLAGGIAGVAGVVLRGAELERVDEDAEQHARLQARMPPPKRPAQQLAMAVMQSPHGRHEMQRPIRFTAAPHLKVLMGAKQIHSTKESFHQIGGRTLEQMNPGAQGRCC